jgi:glutathione S-transferase
MSCHIAFEEAKLQFEAVIGDWGAINKLNPMGAVPVLELGDGKILTQNAAILQYAHHQNPQAGLFCKDGSFEFFQTVQWVSWVTSDLHKTIGELFDDSLSEKDRAEWVELTHERFKVAEKHLEGKTYLVGNQFTAADAYLFTIYGWTKHLKVPMDAYKNLGAYVARIAERPSVQVVMKREGLIK